MSFDLLSHSQMFSEQKVMRLFSPLDVVFLQISIFGSAAARYIDAFMQNVNWEEVNWRVEMSVKI